MITTHRPDKQEEYIAPELYITTCSLERGFSMSDVNAPDFETENVL